MACAAKEKAFKGSQKVLLGLLPGLSMKSSLDLDTWALPLCYPLPLGCTIEIETDSAGPVHGK